MGWFNGLFSAAGHDRTRRAIREQSAAALQQQHHQHDRIADLTRRVRRMESIIELWPYPSEIDTRLRKLEGIDARLRELEGRER